MKIDRLQLVKLRNGFYKDGFRRMSFILLLSLIINLILMTALLITENKSNKTTYFAAGIDGSLKQLIPVDQPVYSTEQVQSWVARIVPRLLHLNFKDYKSQLLETKQYFTPEGWSAFNSAFEDQIEQVVSNRLWASAYIPSTPAVTDELYYKGVYSWRVQVPVRITFEGQDGKATTNQYVWSVLVQRVDNRTNPNLLGIQQVVVRKMD